MVRPLTIIALAGSLAACQGPTSSTAGSSGIGHLYFLRTTGAAGPNTATVLHVATGSDYAARRAFGGDQVVRGRPAVSPDNAYMAWTDVTPGVYPVADAHHLLVRNIKTGATTDLIGAGGVMASEPSWSADARLFVRWRDLYDGQGGKWYLMSMAADGSARRIELESEAVIGRMPAVSPNGREVAWVVAGPNGARLEIIDRASAARLVRTDITRYALMHDPAWAPDGSAIAVVVYVAGPVEDVRLRVVARTGEVLHDLPLDGFIGRPAFAPDGRAVAFCQNQRSFLGGPYESRVRVWTLATGELQVVDDGTQGSDCAPTWSR